MIEDCYANPTKFEDLELFEVFYTWYGCANDDYGGLYAKLNEDYLLQIRPYSAPRRFTIHKITDEWRKQIVDGNPKDVEATLGITIEFKGKNAK